MSIFKKLGKLAGKIAKAGLSVATRGVSDKVLNALKGIAAQKKANATLTRAAEAMALRHAPETKSTTSYARDSLITATRAAGTMGNYKDRTDIDSGNALPGGRSRSVRAPRGARKARSVRRAATKRRGAAPRPQTTAKAPKGRAKRAAPASFAAFAQKAKQLAGQWRAAGGKEGTGQTFFEWKRGK